MNKEEFQFKNKKILIYGFGISGKACFKHLNRNNNTFIYDDNLKLITNKYKTKILNQKKISQHNFNYIVVSPGIDLKKCLLNKYLKKNKKKIISELDVFYLENKKNLKITITGTNGKSTTSKLLYEIIKNHKRDVRLVGNIGNPILLEKRVNPKTIFVIEASSYQIEYSKYFKTDIAAILNISPDHLERHGNIKKYVQSKFKLIKNQKKGSLSFIEKRSKYLDSEIKNNKIKSKIIKISTLFPKLLKKKIKNNYFNNQNNINNLKFILEISKKLKLNKKIIIKTINLFKGLKYRQQIIFNNKKLQIINDSKSTSFASSINLIKSYKNIYWLVGGKYKKGDKFILDKKYYKNIKVYIYGSKSNFFQNQFKNKIKYKIFNNIKKALLKIIEDSKNDNLSKKIILFSPSAASFDQFKNFEERGKYFNSQIKTIKFIKKINGRK
tara:strand:+ start:3975 stop:5294 length:1320 start_codon:yes stop_codon:yes gene_type:complete